MSRECDRAGKASSRSLRIYLVDDEALTTSVLFLNSWCAFLRKRMTRWRSGVDVRAHTAHSSESCKGALDTKRVNHSNGAGLFAPNTDPPQ